MSPRQAAIANGEKLYSGKECPKHKLTKRLTSSRKCYECSKDIQGRYYSNNKEKHLASVRKGHFENREARLEGMRKNYMSKQVNGVAIYGLSTKSNPAEYFYCGQTKTPDVRLQQHKSDARLMKGMNEDKERIIRKALRAEDDDVLMTILEIIPPDKWSDAENDWIDKLNREGHELTNMVCGTIIGEWENMPKRKSLSMNDFHNIKWDKSSPYAKKGEEVGLFGGCELFRKGKKEASMRIRFRHRNYGEHPVHGNGLEEMGQTLLRMLTHGTPENEYMLDQHEQHLRLRGGSL